MSKTTHYYHKDHLGTPRVVTGENGDVLSKHDYTPFGIELPSPYYSPNTHEFTGHERDRETGLDYMKARYYNSGDGRFLSVDPAGGSIDSPMSFNAYAYTGNNPMKMVDPSGATEFIFDSSGGGVDLGKASSIADRRDVDAPDPEKEKKKSEEKGTVNAPGETGSAEREERKKEFEDMVGDELSFESESLKKAAKIAYINDPGFAEDVNEAVEEEGSISVKTGDLKGTFGNPAGEYDPDTQTITIDPNQVKIGSTMDVGSILAHEFGHATVAGEELTPNKQEKIAETAEKRTALKLHESGFMPSNMAQGAQVRTEMNMMGIDINVGEIGLADYSWKNLP